MLQRSAIAKLQFYPLFVGCKNKKMDKTMKKQSIFPYFKYVRSPESIDFTGFLKPCKGVATDVATEPLQLP